jgi:hypothetical protein
MEKFQIKKLAENYKAMNEPEKSEYRKNLDEDTFKKVKGRQIVVSSISGAVGIILAGLISNYYGLDTVSSLENGLVSGYTLNKLGELYAAGTEGQSEKNRKKILSLIDDKK